MRLRPAPILLTASVAGTLPSIAWSYDSLRLAAAFLIFLTTHKIYCQNKIVIDDPIFRHSISHPGVSLAISQNPKDRPQVELQKMSIEH